MPSRRLPLLAALLLCCTVGQADQAGVPPALRLFSSPSRFDFLDSPLWQARIEAAVQAAPEVSAWLEERHSSPTYTDAEQECRWCREELKVSEGAAHVRTGSDSTLAVRRHGPHYHSHPPCLLTFWAVCSPRMPAAVPAQDVWLADQVSGAVAPRAAAATPQPAG